MELCKNYSNFNKYTKVIWILKYVRTPKIVGFKIKLCFIEPNSFSYKMHISFCWDMMWLQVCPIELTWNGFPHEHFFYKVFSNHTSLLQNYRFLLFLFTCESLLFFHISCINFYNFHKSAYHFYIVRVRAIFTTRARP